MHSRIRLFIGIIEAGLFDQQANYDQPKNNNSPADEVEKEFSLFHVHMIQIIAG